MLEDSQRDNIDLKACACEEKSVVIITTLDQNLNAVAEIVFDKMLHSEFEVTGRSVDSILNMITDASQADAAHVMVPAEMIPRAKGMTLQPDAARRKSDEDSAVAVQRGPAMISARSRDNQQAQDVQLQPMQDATVRTKLGVRFVCEDRQSEFCHNGTTEQTFDFPRQSNSSTRAKRNP